MNTRYAIYGGVGLLGGLLILALSKSGSEIKDRWGNTIYRDTSLLIPSFAQRISILMARLRARGFKPMLNETYRTPERALKLATLPEHTGIEKSMHVIGAAVDVIDEDLKWNSPAFFQALGEEAEKLGLAWGGRFSNVDKPHVQAIKPAQQAKLAALSPAGREAFVRGLYV